MPPDASAWGVHAVSAPAPQPPRARTSRPRPSGFSRFGLHRDPEARRRGARVCRDLRLAGTDRPPLQRAQLGLVAADADGEVGRARAAAFPLAHEALHYPVFERVERDDGEAAPRPEHLERGRERALERVELAVDGDAGRRGNRALDRVDKLARALERLLTPAPDDRPRDLPRVALFAVAAEDRGELALVPRVDDVGRARVLRRVHAHVERGVRRIREAALWAVELHRGDAEVEED